MSTDYTFERPLTLERFLAGVVACGMFDVPERRQEFIGDETNGPFKGKLLVRGTIRLNDELAYLRYCAIDGKIVTVERWGASDPREMLERLATCFQMRVMDEHGPVMGQDDWFE